MPVSACRYEFYSLPLRPIQPAAISDTAYRYASIRLPLWLVQPIAMKVTACGNARYILLI
jgi:hypothetical protein